MVVPIRPRTGLYATLIGGGLALLVGTGSLLWWKLPTWAPGWVVDHSPFIDPYYRAQESDQAALIPLAWTLDHEAFTQRWQDAAIPWLIARIKRLGFAQAPFACHLILLSDDPRAAPAILDMLRQGDAALVESVGDYGLRHLDVTLWEGEVLRHLRTALSRFTAEGRRPSSLRELVGSLAVHLPDMALASSLPVLVEAAAALEGASPATSPNPLLGVVRHLDDGVCADLLADPVAQVRRFAIAALANSQVRGKGRWPRYQIPSHLIGSQRILTRLRLLVDDQEGALAEEIVDVIATLDPAGESGSLLDIALAHNGDRQSRRAMDHLLHVASDQALPWLARCLEPERAEVLRYQAVLILIELGTPAAQAVLRSALGDAHHLTRHLTAKALGVILPEDADP